MIHVTFNEVVHANCVTSKESVNAGHVIVMNDVPVSAPRSRPAHALQSWYFIVAGLKHKSSHELCLVTDHFMVLARLPSPLYASAPPSSGTFFLKNVLVVWVSRDMRYVRLVFGWALVFMFFCFVFHVVMFSMVLLQVLCCNLLS